MYKITYFLRLLRNILVALFSTVWVFTLLISAQFVLNYMKFHETELAKKDLPHGLSFSNFELSQTFLEITAFWLMVVVFFWAFVAANRLWPIKGKKKVNQ